MKTILYTNKFNKLNKFINLNSINLLTICVSKLSAIIRNYEASHSKGDTCKL